MNKEEFYPVALTIAESDSGGGSGVQADLRTFNAAGVYCCSVITAVTARNPRQITSFEVMPAKLVREQIKSVMEALSVKSVKTGFLANADIVETVADEFKTHRMPLIVDTVFAAPGKRPDSDMLQAMKISIS